MEAHFGAYFFMASVTVVISAYNEETKIGRCLEALSWADEIVVIDSSSTDKTPAIAKKYTKHVYPRPNYPMLNKNKNYGFDKATSDWIISLDADEVIPPELAREIRKAIEQERYAGYWIPRKNIIFGKWITHGLWWPDKQLRLFRRGRGAFPGKHVHEYVSVDGPTSELATPYIHYNYESVSQFLRKMDTIYTVSEVENHVASGYQLAWYDAIRFPASDFVKIFFAQEGYKDGLHGLVLSMLQAFYSFIVFVKLWERETFPEKEITADAVFNELDGVKRDIAFWQATTRIKVARTPLAKLAHKLRRKLRV